MAVLPLRTLAFARETHCESLTDVWQVSYDRFLIDAVIFDLVPPFLKKM